MKKTRKGFTLIELLVVIAIIGMLSSIVLASLSSARAKARDTRRLADLSELRKALTLCYDKIGSYTFTGETVLTTPGNRERTDDGDFIAGWQAVCSEFMKTLPVDPQGNPYTFHTSNDYQHFVLLTQLETGSQIMTNAQVTTVITSIIGSTGWTQLSSYNYVIGL